MASRKKLKAHEIFILKSPPEFYNTSQLVVYAHEEGDEFWLIKDSWPYIHQTNTEIPWSGDILITQRVFQFEYLATI